MKTTLYFILIMMVAVLFLFTVSCSDDTVSPKDDDNGVVVGTWKESFPEIASANFNGADLYAYIVSSGNVYTLLVTKQNSLSDTTFINKGTWHISENTAVKDSIVLKGNYCAVLDTATNELIQIPDYNDTIYFSMNIKENEWKIPAIELLPVLEQTGMAVDTSDAVIMNMLKNYEITLQRQGNVSL